MIGRHLLDQINVDVGKEADVDDSGLVTPIEQFFPDLHGGFHHDTGRQ